MKTKSKVVNLGRQNVETRTISPSKAQSEKFNFSLKPRQKKVFDPPEQEGIINPGDSLIGDEKDEFLTDREIGQSIDPK